MKKLIIFFLIFIYYFSTTFLLADETVRFNQVSEFQLTERNGKAVNLFDLKGSVWIANFIFTRCQGMCPLMTGQMAVLQKELSDSEIKLVSFSVDPGFDTAEVLGKYAQKYNADPKKWLFLTGPKTVVWSLIMESFQLGIDQASEEDLKQGAELVMHSSRFVLVDQAGMIRGYFDTSEAGKLTELAEAAQELARKGIAL